MVDTSLMRGEGWVRCCICGELHTAPYPDLHRDSVGQIFDLCKGKCAFEAGM